MTQSPEFPELQWMPPASFSYGRVAGQPTVVVIHSTEGSEGPQSAEDGAAYDQRRTDGTSTHFFVDTDSVIQCVRTTDRAHHARATGNKIGIGFELCGRAGQTSTQWHDAASAPMLRLAATYVAKCCRKYDIPVRRLTVAQLRDGEKGICGHVDITNAFGESTHTDPGPNFPWTEMLEMVQAELNGDDDVSDVFTKPLGADVDNKTLDQLVQDVWYWARKGGNGMTALEAKLAKIQITADAALAAARSDDEAGIKAHIDAKVAELAQAQAATRDAILAALPAGSDPVSREELEEALRAALGDQAGADAARGGQPA
jgi:N-acetyl-anhydromuramyl-L-alanine amidase AmpD